MFEKPIVEVTGPPGAGKSTYVRDTFPSARIIAGYPSAGTRPAMRGAASLVKLLGLRWAAPTLSRGDVAWLLRAALKYDETPAHRLNAARNALLKFTLRDSAETQLVVDEGISHIPFILDLDRDGIEAFLARFRRQLLGRQIHFLGPPSMDTWIRRLERRGHRRIRGGFSAADMVRSSATVSRVYLESIRATDLDVLFVSRDRPESAGA